MITRGALVVLEALVSDGPATHNELVTNTDLTRSTVYGVVDDLLDAGLLEEQTGYGSDGNLRASDDPIVETYRTLRVSCGDLDWPSRLSPATLSVCWFLCEPRSLSTVASRLGITREGVHDALSPLKGLGAFAPAGPQYAISEEFEPLQKFAHSVVERRHLEQLHRIAPNAIPEWCDPNRALVRGGRPADTRALRSNDDWKPTGLAAFGSYGLTVSSPAESVLDDGWVEVPTDTGSTETGSDASSTETGPDAPSTETGSDVLSTEPAFWYNSGADKLTPEQIVCHTLVCGTDSRRVGYAMLLIELENLERDSLLEVARWYDLELAVGVIYRAIEESIESTEFIELPSDREYEALKAKHGVR